VSIDHVDAPGQCLPSHVTLARYSAACEDSEDIPSALSPASRDSIVTHENFPEFVNLTVKKQLQTNLLPLIAHIKTAFDVVVPMEVRSTLAPQQLRYWLLHSYAIELLNIFLAEKSSKAEDALMSSNGCSGEAASILSRYSNLLSTSSNERICICNGSSKPLPRALNRLCRSSFPREDDVVIWFWEHLRECSEDERRAIWSWTTGIKEMPSDTTRM